MSPEHLSSIAVDVPGLLALLLVRIPDDLVHDSWIVDGADWQADEIARDFGDLYRRNREGLKALSSRSSDLQVTLESPEHRIILREVRSDFVYACIFERDAPLGRVRLVVRRLEERLADFLPTVEVETGLVGGGDPQPPPARRVPRGGGPRAALTSERSNP